MNTLEKIYITAAVFLLCNQYVLAEEYEVGQLNKAFTTESLTIKKGDTISFVNHDDFFHNIFSLSDTASFDLGSYPKGEAKSYTFDTAGEVVIECAIHPDMKLKITVE